MVGVDKTTPWSKLNPTLYLYNQVPVNAWPSWPVSTVPNLYGVRSQGGGLCPHIWSHKRAVTNKTPPHQGNRSQQNVVSQPESARLLTLPRVQAPPECIYRHTCLCCRKGPRQESECLEPIPQGEDDHPPAPKSARTSKQPIAGLQWPFSEHS